ncbi:MAG: hypothetical protein HZB79_09045 [Deltaproteobacteria bacterium]|nr:hypothetical protein [Deltaproteobacteria bacterium]
MNIVYMVLTLVLTLAVIFLIITLAGKFIKKLPPNAVKAINKISFFFAALSGLLIWLKATILPSTMLVFVFIFSLIVYFIFFNYDRAGEKK